MSQKYYIAFGNRISIEDSFESVVYDVGACELHHRLEGAKYIELGESRVGRKWASYGH